MYRVLACSVERGARTCVICTRDITWNAMNKIYYSCTSDLTRRKKATNYLNVQLKQMSVGVVMLFVFTDSALF
jgi:hypothetical protein